jgi:hypothetical protein
MEKRIDAELQLMEATDVTHESRRSQASPVLASHSRYIGDYVYDVEVVEVAKVIPHAKSGRCRAQALNIRVDSNQAVSIDAELLLAYGATPYEAFENIEAIVAKWVNDSVLTN